MTSASRIFWQHGKFLTKISNIEFPLSCLEFLIIHKTSVQVNFCGKVLSGNKTENDNSPQTPKYKIFWG